MSLQVLAQDMASRGRGPDTMLVHMAPSEVRGLQALAMAHGGSLTRNPDTGLPEAGFLKNLLPTLIGAGLMFATGGAAAPGLFGLSKAATIGLGIGGLQALRTGSLSKGLMAGLGAYGGAGLMGGVMGAGTGAVSQAAGTEGVNAYAANSANAIQPVQAVTPPSPVASPYFPEGVGGEFMRPAYTPGALGSGTFNVAQDAAALTNTGAAGYSPIATPMNAPVANTMIAPSVTPAQAFPGATGVAPQYGLTQEAIDIGRAYGQEQAAQNAVAKQLATTTPMQTARAGLGAIADKPSLLFNKENLKYGAAALAPTMFQEPKSVQAPRDTEQFRYAYDPGREMPPTRMGDVGEFQYFRPSYTRLAADGGLMDALPVQRMSDRNDAQMMMANGGQMYAAGGISHLGDYSDGGRLLKGPGDGVSDSIPASIADKRPARLADGEFVVPARIVSELGNGSTDAGARKLYAMMDRVQKNRNKTVGKGKIAVDSRSEKLLPA